MADSNLMKVIPLAIELLEDASNAKNVLDGILETIELLEDVTKTEIENRKREQKLQALREQRRFIDAEIKILKGRF